MRTVRSDREKMLVDMSCLCVRMGAWGCHLALPTERPPQVHVVQVNHRDNLMCKAGQF